MKILHCIEKEIWEKMEGGEVPWKGFAGKESVYPLLFYRIFLESFPSFR